MEIKRIITNRRIDPHHANALLYEWEEDLCDCFGAYFHYNKPCQNKRYSKFIPFLLNFVQTSKPAFTFEMCIYRHSGNNKRNIIPCILDYYVHSPFLARLLFKCLYWRNPAICVSSPEVYGFLSSVKASRKLFLLSLTISDRYKISPDSKFFKKYDIFIAGRQNPVLSEWFKRYCKAHPDTTYVYSKRLPNGDFRFFNQKDECLSEDDSRESYVSFMRSSRACMYSPQGIDGSRKTNGFEQVTPHFLEVVACGCHPLLRYNKNIESDYFELASFCPHIDSYELFEKLFDKARVTDVDMKKHSEYMKSHYTSVAAEKLKQIVSNL